MSNYSFGRGRRENSRSNNSLGDYFNTGNNGGRNSEFSDNRRNERRGGRRETGSLRHSGSSGGLNGSERGFRRSSSYQRLPREEGMIVSLLESFGFIKCAQREEDVFFHYSEMERNSYHPSELEIGMEVDFDIGPSSQGNNRSSNPDKEKLAAFRVNVLPKGTVKWELPDEDGILKKQGKVEKAARVQHSRSTDIRTSPYDGTISLILESEDNDDDDEENASNDGPKMSNKNHTIPYSIDDYDPERNQPSRLARGDLVEFETVIERRTNKKIAKNIRLIQSERERQRELREKKMLAEATHEEGVVVSLSDKDGFLRSSTRREHVYFQYTYIELPDTDPNSDSNNEYTLAVGQDMEFLVCKETANGRNHQVNRLVARQIKFLPKDSVQFYQSIASGVIGTVSTLPSLSNPTRRRGQNHPKNVESAGKIRLKNPISFENSEVTEVILDVNEVPGGTYAANRDGSQVGLWIRDGDVLLFDVIKEKVDGTFHAKPTQYKLPPNESDDDTKLSERKDIRLLQPSLAGRFQGTVSALKEGYGFITCAERAIDVYFRLYEIFPNSLQSDIVRYSSSVSNGSDVQKLMVGSQVTFDILLTSTGPQDHSRGRHSKSHNMENMKAQRICIVPNGSFDVDILISENMRATVKQVHKDKSGYLELSTPVTAMSHDDRHPLVAALLNSIEQNGESVVYPMSLGANEAQVVMSMAEQKGLDVEFVGGNKDATSPDPSINGYARMKISPRTLTDSSISEGAEPNEINSTVKEIEESKVNSLVEPTPANENTNANKSSSKKRSTKKTKPVKTIRFERNSIASDNKGGAPDVGDVIECNITQSRKTGAYLATNMKIIERKMVERNTVDTNESHLKPLDISGSGLVTEIVLKRDFGFITQIDENSLKKEVLFFHMSSVITQDSTEETLNDSPEKHTRKHRGKHHDHVLIRKGDEVKFDVGKNEKNGKRIAMNIVVLPQGTLQIPFKAEKNACTGIILMEPSHTSLSNTPAHATSLSASTTKSPGGRWADVKESKKKKESGSKMSEQGVILLLTDPHGHPNKSIQADSTSDIENVSTKVSELTVEGGSASAQNEGQCADPTPNGKTENNINSMHYEHVIYRSVGVAVRGVGSSSSVDTGGAPRRGDLVSFAKGKGSSMTAKDVRIISRSSATTKQGYLMDISTEKLKATFVVDSDKAETYEISLKEVISCDIKLINESTKVEGIVHEGKIYGVCRTTDLYLTSKIQIGKKERPRLNLTVKKELKDMGGKIVAQSGLAKGPDGTIGFAEGWTKRASKYDVKIVEEEQIPIEESETIDENHE